MFHIFKMNISTIITFNSLSFLINHYIHIICKVLIAVGSINVFLCMHCFIKYINFVYLMELYVNVLMYTI